MAERSAVKSHRDLEVYGKAFDAARWIFVETTRFPKEERYSLTSQMRRSSRSVCANIAEAWRKRRYEANFLSKLNDAEGEAAETQVWLEFAVDCEYIQADRAREVYAVYDEVLKMIVALINNPTPWLLPNAKRRKR